MAIHCRALVKGDKQKFLQLIQQVSDEDAWNMNYYVEEVKPEGYKSHIIRHFEGMFDDYVKDKVVHVMFDDEEMIGYAKVFIKDDIVDIWDSYLIPAVRDQGLNVIAWEYLQTLGEEFVAHTNPNKAGNKEFLESIGFDKPQNHDNDKPFDMRLKKNKEKKEKT